jgi:hydrogenase maturation protease
VCTTQDQGTGVSVKSTLILGIGNTLLGDEGAGVHALERIRTLLDDGSDVDLLDGGTLCFTLLPTLESYRRLIVLDAAQLGAAAGAVDSFEGRAMDEFLGRPRRSVHEVGLCDLMTMAQLSGCFPQHRALIGVQPEFIDWSEACSPPVEASLDEVARRAVEFVRRWDLEDTARAAA